MVFGPYPAVVTHIHDGDTCTLDIDLGFGVHQETLSCRFYGINAPELATVAGKDALAFLLTILKIGDAVMVVSHGFDKYGGRFDGEMTKPGDATTINAQMLAAGKAVPMP
jgi:endonuclease YncB( thermonuclease family)